LPIALQQAVAAFAIAVAIGHVPMAWSDVPEQATPQDSSTPATGPASNTLSAQGENLTEAVPQSERQIIDAYLKLPQADRLKEVTEFGKRYLAALNEGGRSSGNKSLYDESDLYSPESYRKISDRSYSVCYLSRGADRLGTCFMIGRNLVLTCSHVLRILDRPDDYYAVGTLKASFGPGENPAVEEAFPVVRIAFQGKESTIDGVATGLLDFALLELGPSEVDQKLPSDKGIDPLPIDKNTQYPRGTAVYVIGYPGRNGRRMIADRARIFVEFDSSYTAFVGYMLQAYGEAAQLLERATEEGRGKDPTRQLVALETARLLGDQLIANAQRSFRRGVSEPPRWYLVSEFVATPPHPAFALNSDTSHGNSGSPVLSRVSSEVTGLFFRGMDDRKVGLKVGFLQHEEAIPIHVILQNWKKNEPNQPVQYDVKF
jgi:V8-like Glu-specific endopeptidase